MKQFNDILKKEHADIIKEASKADWAAAPAKAVGYPMKFIGGILAKHPLKSTAGILAGIGGIKYYKHKKNQMNTVTGPDYLAGAMQAGQEI
jgi:hypothetical protein